MAANMGCQEIGRAGHRAIACMAYPAVTPAKTGVQEAWRQAHRKGDKEIRQLDTGRRRYDGYWPLHSRDCAEAGRRSLLGGSEAAFAEIRPRPASLPWSYARNHLIWKATAGPRSRRSLRAWVIRGENGKGRTGCLPPSRPRTHLGGKGTRRQLAVPFFESMWYA